MFLFYISLIQTIIRDKTQHCTNLQSLLNNLPQKLTIYSHLEKKGE